MSTNDFSAVQNSAYLPVPLGYWNQGKHPANTQLGPAHATSTSGMTWAKYAEKTKTTYTSPTSGVVEADRRAQAIIAGNKEKQRIKDIFGQKPEFNPANLDKWSGHGPNPGLDDLNHWYSNMEQADNLVTNNKINDLTGKVDDVAQNVKKLKRGIGKANGKIIGKIDGLTGKVDDIAGGMTKLTGKVDDIAGGMTKLTGKVDDIAGGMTKLTGKVDYVAQNVEKLRSGLGEVSGKIIGKVDANGRAIGDLANKVDDIAKQMAKQNTKMALLGGAIALAGIAAAGIAGYLLGKNNDKDDQVASEETTPVVTTPEEKPKPEEPTPVPPVVPVEPTEPTQPTQPTEPTEPTEPSLVDADGKMTVQKGDGLWHIAERYLEDKFKTEPEKFANLTKKEQNKMIWEEVHRIADLNGFKLVSTIIKGKKLLVTEPMLHTGDKVQVVKKVDIAA